MRPQKERSPWRWLLLIPAQLVVGGLTFFAGVAIDGTIFSGAGSGEVIGHGMPIFSILLFLIAGIATAVVVIVALVGLTVGLIRRSRRRAETLAQTQMQREP